MAPARDNEFLPEVWGLYAFGTLWLVLRFFVRLRTVGFMGLRLEDALALMALAAWTYTCAVVHVTYYTGTTIDYTPEEVAQFDEHKFKEVIYGSKLFLGSWYAYITLIFTLKGMVVLLYRRIFFERWQKWMIYFTAFLCIGGFTGLTLGLSFRCLPFHERWQIIPKPSITCTASPNVLIATSCMNAVTDVFLLTIPIPILYTLQKPLRTRLLVFILLASGFFVLAACITRVVLTVVPNMFVLNIARWGIREFAVAIVAVNSASLRPMFRRRFWSLNSPTHKPQNEKRKAPPTMPSLNHIASSRIRAVHLTLSRIRNARRRDPHYLETTSIGGSTTDDYIPSEPAKGSSSMEAAEHPASDNIGPSTPKHLMQQAPTSEEFDREFSTPQSRNAGSSFLSSLQSLGRWSRPTTTTGASVCMSQSGVPPLEARNDMDIDLEKGEAMVREKETGHGRSDSAALAWDGGIGGYAGALGGIEAEVKEDYKQERKSLEKKKHRGMVGYASTLAEIEANAKEDDEEERKSLG